MNRRGHSVTPTTPRTAGAGASEGRECKHPKVSEMTEEHYEGAFVDTPIAVFASLLCTKCGATVRGWETQHV